MQPHSVRNRQVITPVSTWTAAARSILTTSSSSRGHSERHYSHSSAMRPNKGNGKWKMQMKTMDHRRWTIEGRPFRLSPHEYRIQKTGVRRRPNSTQSGDGNGDQKSVARGRPDWIRRPARSLLISWRSSGRRGRRSSCPRTTSSGPARWRTGWGS